MFYKTQDIVYKFNFLSKLRKLFSFLIVFSIQSCTTIESSVDSTWDSISEAGDFIYDSVNFIIKNCHIEAKKNGIDYNNVLNVFNHSGKIEKSSIYAFNYCIKLINNSNLNIIDSSLESNNKCILLNENTYLVLKNITIKNSNENFIEYKNNSCPKYNLLIEKDIIFKN